MKWKPTAYLWREAIREGEMPFRERIEEHGGETEYILDEQFLGCFLGENEEEATKLYKDYKKLISQLAFQFSKRSGVDAQDLFQEGLIGLARARRDYNPKRMVCTNCNKVEQKCGCDKPNLVNRVGRFHNFAVALIRNALREAVYANETPVPVPSYLKESNYYYAKILDILSTLDIPQEAKERYVEEEAVRADDIGIEKPQSTILDGFKSQIVNRVRWKKMKYNEVLEKAIAIPRRSFIDVHRSDFDGALEEMDDEMLDKITALERVRELVGDETYEILFQYFVDGETIDSISDRVGKTSGRISQIITAARESLQKKEKYILDGDNPVKRKV
jgi:DNA-directed RNA polymerase specialized sigma subunit